ncbi:carbohydrate esterase family 12 protein [Didymella exigua CBS 183.55]|uniref:Carbohydrate esterase family 12 protein n=1 Tax=Didymella exigua CBS 183.55 TaxID=1150837 RepID=A0A6A5RX60_9PLEO|nr:carbohydrate esterase family 12 protein [Didymella exigua CBS 183.55]KAF1932139.1 carbohydrate esterase family 12 protein [Didymella exigua CBS 183.55]
MKLLAVLSTAIAAVSAVPTAAAAPKVLICSDSTTANYAEGSVLQGWGYYLHNYLTIPVVNLAVNGRSTRSFINEGKWTALLAQTNPGDFVLVEMGHNDDVDPTTDTRDRGVLPGAGNETIVVTTATGANETVHTFGWYLRSMIADVRAQHAVPVLSGMVPRNYWTGDTLQARWPFADTAQLVARTARVQYVDHTKYGVNALQALGPVQAKTLFPNDNTHTNPAGAVLNAEAFVTGVNLVTQRPLKRFLE